MPTCCGWQRARVPCVVPPDHIVWAPDGTPRLACPFHALDHLRDIGGGEACPEGLPGSLLGTWRGREKRLQAKLRAEIAALTGRLAASEERTRSVEAELRGQPRLALEVAA